MRGLVLDPSESTGIRLRDDLAVPIPKAGEIRVRVAYASVNSYELDIARNPLVRLIQFVRRAPGEVRTGLEFSGTADTDGLEFAAGDPVFGYVEMIGGWKPHGEYLAIPERYVAHAPKGMPLDRAAALPMSAQTALVALQQVARVQPGQRVLVLGASGGVGVMVVQIARILGAEVTAVAGKRHHARLSELGATHTSDYRGTPLDRMTGSFDAILDFSRTAYLSEVRHLLADGGVFIPADPVRNIRDVTLSRRAKYLMVDRGDSALLRQIARWAEEGKIESMVDEVFELDDWPVAVKRSRERGRLGRTMLQLGRAVEAGDP